MRWISVKDRMPQETNEVVDFDETWKESDFVLVYAPNAERYYPDFYVGQTVDGKWHLDGDVVETTTVVTHWMPIPEPPEDMTRVCKVCGKQFVGRRKNNTLCDVCGSPAMKCRRTRAKKKLEGSATINDAPRHPDDLDRRDTVSARV